MRNYTEAEKCMLLLLLPMMETRAIRPGEFARMERMLKALGSGKNDLGGDVTERELMRLGLSAETAREMHYRLEQAPVLEQMLKNLDKMGVIPITRISPEYPQKLRRTLGTGAPLVLYCAGNPELFGKPCVSLVGSRKMRPAGAAFARRLGASAARENLTYVSGGAAGADTLGFEAAIEQGGSAVLFLADSLLARMRDMRTLLESGRLLLVSEYGCDQPFSKGRAHSRNRLIHAMGERVFVAQTDYGSGGTWSGTISNLKNGWSPVYMCNDEPEDPGTLGLIERGGIPVTAAELRNILRLETEQIKLFEI